MVEAANLASVFQLTAGISLAINVFRAPHEQEYQRLGSILDAEETLLRGRSGPQVDEQVTKVASVRTDWIIAGRDLQSEIARWEHLIWIGVVLSIGLLLFCCLGSYSLDLWWAATLIAASVAPISIGGWRMWHVTKLKLRPIRAAAAKL